MESTMVETFRSWNLLANVTKQGFPPQGASGVAHQCKSALAPFSSPAERRRLAGVGVAKDSATETGKCAVRDQ